MTETERWDGFTGLNGLAVAEDGRHVYVSQIFGTDGPPTGTGNVVRFDTEAETWTSVEVPFPSGLALGTVASDADSVYVSAYSISPADDDDPATADATEGGQVWRFSFPDDATESALPVTTPADSAATATATPTATTEPEPESEPTVTESVAPATDDDGTTETELVAPATDDDGTTDSTTDDSTTGDGTVGDIAVGEGGAVAAL